MFLWTELPLENAITWTLWPNWIKASLPGCRALIHLHWISLIPIIYLQLKIVRLVSLWKSIQVCNGPQLTFAQTTYFQRITVWLLFFQHIYCYCLHGKKVNNKVLYIIYQNIYIYIVSIGVCLTLMFVFLCV